ncbi:MAG: 4Fe-4S binding protein [bacterium]|nr:4Fe-4S binding protein [bacterium]
MTIIDDRCKRCGICSAFCPGKVFSPDKEGFPVVAFVEKCIGCRACVLRCPDFAVKVVAK